MGRPGLPRISRPKAMARNVRYSQDCQFPLSVIEGEGSHLGLDIPGGGIASLTPYPYWSPYGSHQT